MPDVRQVDAVGSRGGCLIQIDGDAQLLADPAAELLRQHHAFGHLHIAERHERHDIGRADARMRPAMLLKIDVRGRGLDRVEHRRHHRLGRRDQGEHRAVVIFIALDIQQLHVGVRAQCVSNRFEHFGAPPLAKVGDTLDEPLHETSRYDFDSGQAAVIIGDWAANGNPTIRYLPSALRGGRMAANCYDPHALLSTTRPCAAPGVGWTAAVVPLLAGLARRRDATHPRTGALSHPVGAAHGRGGSFPVAAHRGHPGRPELELEVAAVDRRGRDNPVAR